MRAARGPLSEGGTKERSPYWLIGSRDPTALELRLMYLDICPLVCGAHPWSPTRCSDLGILGKGEARSETQNSKA